MTNVDLVIKKGLLIEPVFQKLSVHLFLGIMSQWKVSDTDILTLTGLDLGELILWKQRLVPPMNCETYMRISTVVAVNKALKVLMKDPSDIARWIRKPNHSFVCNSSLDLMLSKGVRGMHDINKQLHFEAYIEPEMITIN